MHAIVDEVPLRCVLIACPHRALAGDDFLVTEIAVDKISPTHSDGHMCVVCGGHGCHIVIDLLRALQGRFVAPSGGAGLP